MEFGLGRLLLRHALKTSGHRGYCIHERQHKAPTVRLDSTHIAPRFSISHSLGWVGIAYCESPTVSTLGLDIQILKTSLGEQQASYFCNDEQIEAAQGLTQKEKTAYFTRLWTYKEAYCKSLGLAVLSKKSKAADFEQDKNMQSALLDKTHFLSIYSNTRATIEPQFLTLGDYGELNTSQIDTLIWQ